MYNSPPRRETEGLNEFAGYYSVFMGMLSNRRHPQVEINPLVKTTDGRFVAADAKVAIDDDAFSTWFI